MYIYDMFVILSHGGSGIETFVENLENPFKYDYHYKNFILIFVI